MEKDKGSCTVEVGTVIKVSDFETIRTTVSLTESYDDSIPDNRDNKYYELLEQCQMKLLEGLEETFKSVVAYKKAKKEK